MFHEKFFYDCIGVEVLSNFDMNTQENLKLKLNFDDVVL